MKKEQAGERDNSHRMTGYIERKCLTVRQLAATGRCEVFHSKEAYVVQYDVVSGLGTLLTGQ